MTRAFLIPCGVVLLSSGLVGQQNPPPVFRGHVEKVRVDALVTDHNRPVSGLVADDFEVKDNGVVVRDLEISTTAGSVSVAVALDLSGSVEQQGLQDLTRACQALVDALDPDDTAWLVTFSNQFALKAGPVKDPDVVRRALASIRAGGGTSMWDAVFGSLSLVSGQAGRSLVILLSDGMDTTSWLSEKRAMEILKRADVTLNAIRPPDVPYGFIELEAAAKLTGGDVRDAEKGAKLQEQFVRMLNEFRLGYVLTYSPPAAGIERRDGWHKIEVKLKHKNGDVRTRAGYYTPGGTRGGDVH
jgi:VWFA-related protein